MYAKAGNKAAFDRKAGFTRIQQQMILSFIDSHGSINQAETIELKGFALAARCSLTARASPMFLMKVADDGKRKNPSTT